ncbi:MAG: GntR family transcriptional regulator [Acidimicrobiales bacterium]
MITDAASPVPLYYQVFGVLRQRILDGLYAPQERLISEDELAVEFGVSRATIRQAVGELVQQGLVSRQQGRGTFVLPTAAHVLGQRFRGSLADLISETQRTEVSTVEVVHDTPIPARVSAILEIGEARGTIVRRRRAMDGRVFAFTVNYLPMRFGELVSEAELRSSGLMTLLEQKGVVFTGGSQSIRAELADVDVSRWLEVDFGAPILFVERLLLSGDGDPCEFVRSHYRGDLYEFTVSLELAGKEGAALRSQLA